MAGSNKKYKQKHKKKSPVIAPSVANAINYNKKPRSQYSDEEVIEYDHLTPLWSFKRIIREEKWTFTGKECSKNIENGVDPKCILSKLAEFENMTWREIKQQTHGAKGRSSNHFVDISKLNKEAQRRLRDLQLTENIFSLRLGGTIRIYGLLQSRVFEILWYDTEHEIYPLNK